VGELAIESEDDKIVATNFLKDSKQPTHLTPVIEQCMEEFDEYFLKDANFSPLNGVVRDRFPNQSLECASQHSFRKKRFPIPTSPMQSVI